jgi:gas vesicle protein
VAVLLGLFGTVVGAVLTTWTAHQTADRSARHTREELRRQEYRSAVVQFASALGIYRTAEMDRWHAQHGGFRDEASAAADVYRARTAVWNAFYELELSADNRELVHDDLAEIITMARLNEPGRSALTEVVRPSGR